MEEAEKKHKEKFECLSPSHFPEQDRVQLICMDQAGYSLEYKKKTLKQ